MERWTDGLEVDLNRCFVREGKTGRWKASRAFSMGEVAIDDGERLKGGSRAVFRDRGFTASQKMADWMTSSSI
jgi:hypothetical protein